MANFVHTVRISNLRKKFKHNGQEDVVCHATWKLVSYREDYPDTKLVFDGATPFEIGGVSSDTENFTCFCDLSEAQVISWVEANAWNLGDLKLKHEEKINESINPSETGVAAPWQTSADTPPVPPEI